MTAGAQAAHVGEGYVRPNPRVPGATALHGGIDTLTRRRIVGWAWDGERPDVPAALVVAIGSRVLGRERADLYREDLEFAGYSLGLCGFELSLPPHLLKPRESYEITVMVEGPGLPLPGSPYLLVPAMRVVREIAPR